MWANKWWWCVGPPFWWWHCTTTWRCWAFLWPAAREVLQAAGMLHSCALCRWTGTVSSHWLHQSDNQNVYLRIWSVTCPCGPVVKALGRHVQQSMTCSVAGVQTSAQARPPTKELLGWLFWVDIIKWVSNVRPFVRLLGDRGTWVWITRPRFLCSFCPE